MERYTAWPSIFLVLIKFIIFIFIPISQDAPFFAADNGTRGNITRHNSAHTNYDAIAYFGAWHDTYIHTYPHVATNNHWFLYKLLIIGNTISFITMIGCVEDKIPAYMTIVPYSQSPISLYPGVIPNMHIITYHDIFW